MCSKKVTFPISSPLAQHQRDVPRQGMYLIFQLKYPREEGVPRPSGQYPLILSDSTVNSLLTDKLFHLPWYSIFIRFLVDREKDDFWITEAKS